MTDEFQRGLITGLAMQPLQVTTEHSSSEPVEKSVPFIQAFAQLAGMINVFYAGGDDSLE